MNWGTVTKGHICKLKSFWHWKKGVRGEGNIPMPPRSTILVIFLKKNNNFCDLRTDQAPRGSIPGPCPPKWLLVPFKRKLCPPKRGLCPKEINRLGAAGVQIEAQIGICHWNFRNFCGLTPDFMTFLGWKPFFFRKSPVFGRKNRFNSRFRPENPFESLVFTLFIWSRLG